MKQSIEVLQSFWAIHRVTTQLTQQDAARFGLTLQQLAILNTVRAFPEMTLKELTGRLFSAKSTMSVSVDGLVNLGYIKREQSHEDRREIRLVLTPAGEEVSRNSSKNSSVYKVMDSALAQMSEEEIQTLLTIHQTLLKNIQDAKEQQLSRL